MSEVGVIAQLDDRGGHVVTLERLLVVADVGDRRAVDLDPVAVGRADVRDVADLDVARPEVISPSDASWNRSRRTGRWPAPGSTAGA